jgi:hypothetical protein
MTWCEKPLKWYQVPIVACWLVGSFVKSWVVKLFSEKGETQ